MKVEDVGFEGVKIITPQVFRDSRGFFLETFNRSRYLAAGIEDKFSQDNLSVSKYGTIRGMHFQIYPGQAKLIKVIKGKIFDVFVDIRKDSPSYKQWHGVYLDETSHRQLYLPVGYAHGFCCLSEEAYVLYKVSKEYDPKQECTFRYNDRDIQISWPFLKPILSERDLKAPSFQEIEKDL